MCLSLAISRPDSVEVHSKHADHEYIVTTGNAGFRCGYVKVEPRHPWYGVEYMDVDAEVHGGLTFSEPDVNCGKDGPDNGYWVGFDCGHAGDAKDPSIEDRTQNFDIIDSMWMEFACGITQDYPMGSKIWTTEDVVAECKLLCDQAKSALLSAPESDDFLIA